MVNESVIREILEDMFYVSDEANPNNLLTEGKTTWKKFFDTKFGRTPSSEEIMEELEFHFDDITEKQAMEIYNDPEELNFWVYDRYNDGSFIMYTLFGNENSKWGTYEITVDEILPL